MAEFDLFKSALDAGMAFTELTRQRAENIVRDLIRNGELNREQAGKQVEDLLERSRRNTEQLVSMIRREVDQTLAELATRDDLSRLAASLGVTWPPRGGRAARGARRTTSKAAAPAKRAVKKAAGATKKAAGATRKRAAGTANKATGAAKKAAGTAKRAAKKASG